MIRVAVVLFIVLAAVSGCKGSTSSSVDPSGFSPDAIQDANDSRLDPVADPDQSVVSGELTIAGFTVLDETGLPVMDGQGAIKAAARLLDPGDDILSEVIPGLNGRFELVTDDPVEVGIVEIEFRVAEDVDGDGEGEDTISQRVPVALEPGRTVELSLVLEKGLNTVVDGALPVASPESPGEFMITQFTALDANGMHEVTYGTFFADGSVIYDLDGDEFLEAGDDLSGPDINNNGWADNSEAVFSGGPFAFASLTGIVTSVSVAGQQLTVRDEAGTTVTVDLLPFAAVEVLGDDLLFIGPTSLGPHLVGMQAYIEGSAQPGGGFAASWVVVQD